MYFSISITYGSFNNSFILSDWSCRPLSEKGSLIGSLNGLSCKSVISEFSRGLTIYFKALTESLPTVFNPLTFGKFINSNNVKIKNIYRKNLLKLYFLLTFNVLFL